VFANAAIAKYALLGTITEEFYDSIFNINVKGVLFTVQKALPLLPDGASIILTASIAASKGMPSDSILSATKAAILRAHLDGRPERSPHPSQRRQPRPDRNAWISQTSGVIERGRREIDFDPHSASAGSELPMGSPKPLYSSHRRTAASSQESSCSSMEDSNLVSVLRSRASGSSGKPRPEPKIAPICERSDRIASETRSLRRRRLLPSSQIEQVSHLRLA
jgi:hypothetical protein